MAKLEEGLVSYLSGSAVGLTPLIGTRVHHMRKPQSLDYPCLTFQRIDTPRAHTMDTSGSAGNLAHPRIQFDAWASTYGAAKQITDTLTNALNGKTGTIGTGGSAVNIRSALIDNEAPDFDTLIEMYRSRTDFIVWHEE